MDLLLGVEGISLRFIVMVEHVSITYCCNGVYLQN